MNTRERATAIVVASVVALMACPAAGAEPAPPSAIHWHAHDLWEEASAPPPAPNVTRWLHDTTVSTRYPDAAVDHLLDDDVITVNDDGTYLETQHIVNRILNKRGREGWSDASKGYQDYDQEVTLDWARTIDASGTVIPISPTAVKDSTPYSGYPEYDHHKIKTWTYPAMAPGVMTECHITTKGTKPELDRDFTSETPFSDFQPCQLKIVQISVPADRQTTYGLMHPDSLIPVQFSRRTAGNRIVYRWEARDLPYIHAESHMPPAEEWQPVMWLTTVHSWKDVNDWFLKVNRDQAVVTPEIAALVTNLTRDLKTPDQKARALYDWVVTNVRYVEADMKDAGFKALSAQTVLDRRYGDCKDGSTLLLAMLRAAGIPAHYVLVQTNGNGPVNAKSPTAYFDHCIVGADLPSGLTFLDNVGKTMAFRSLPAMDQGVKALMLMATGPRWVDIPFERNGSTLTVQYQLAADDSANATYLQTFYGNSESATRADYQGASRSRIKEAFESYAADKGGKLLNYRISDPFDLDVPFSTHCRFHVDRFAARAGDLLVLALNGMAGDGMGAYAVPHRHFSQWWESLYSYSSEESVNIPAGYRIRYIPPDFHADTPEYEVSNRYRHIGKTIVVDYAVRFKERSISPAQYQQLRQIHHRIALYGKEIIVLQKLLR